MNNQIHFKNFEPDFQIRLQANIMLSRLLDSAPYGATAIGLLEKRGENDFCCALDIYSRQGPFVASAVGTSPENALFFLEEKIKRQIARWKTPRGERVFPLGVTNSQGLLLPRNSPS